jgi:hypothetical protein
MVLFGGRFPQVAPVATHGRPLRAQDYRPNSSAVSQERVRTSASRRTPTALPCRESCISGTLPWPCDAHWPRSVSAAPFIADRLRSVAVPARIDFLDRACSKRQQRLLLTSLD